MPIQQLGPYRVLRSLGHGGMGTVYAAVHQQTGESAAIKVLAETLAADPRFRERFLGEVETLKRLRHENIVTLFGHGEQDGRLFFVMELVDGPSLEADLQAGRRFTWQEVVAITVQVCAALKHAHDHGVIHRDLKPANLLRTAAGVVKLTDFGIAKFFGSSGLTLAGSMIGTPEYMAPEQTEGKPATARSDLYSLGCVMYALLAGKPPFFGPSVTHVLDRVRFQDPDPLRLTAAHVPAALDEIIAQLLKKKPDDRIQTAQTLTRLLQAMQHALLSAAPPHAAAGPDATAETVLFPRPEAEPASLLPTAERPTVDLPAPVPRAPAALPAAPFTAAQAPHTEAVPPAAEHAVPAPVPDSPTDHYVTVTERERREVFEQRPARRRSLWEWLPIVALALALIGIVAAFLWVLRPPSADRLYARIQQLAQQPEPPEQYEPALDEFLERFPADPRATAVQDLHRSFLCVKLRQELLRKLRSLSSLEKLYLQGMQQAEEGHPAEARRCFQQIVEACEGSVFTPQERKLLQQSQTMLRRLPPP